MVFLVDMEKDTAVPLIINTPFQEYFYQKCVGIQAMVKQYAETMIHPEDRERFLAFNESESMMNRIRQNPEGTISGVFRTLGNDGSITGIFIPFSRYVEWKNLSPLYRPNFTI